MLDKFILRAFLRDDVEGETGKIGFIEQWIINNAAKNSNRREQDEFRSSIYFIIIAIILRCKFRNCVCIRNMN